MRNPAPVIAKWSRNEATDEDLAPIHLVRFPKNISGDVRQAVVSHIARHVSTKTGTKPSYFQAIDEVMGGLCR